MDVALILGLRVIAKPVILKEDEPFSDLERLYGATVWNRKITVASIEERLESLGGRDDADFTRSFLLFVFATLLFPKTNYKVDSCFIPFLRDLDKVKDFAWGAAVHEEVLNWLCRKKETNVQYVGGCLIFFQALKWSLGIAIGNHISLKYKNGLLPFQIPTPMPGFHVASVALIWFYEHVDIGRPTLRDCSLTFPRVCRWENSRSKNRQWFMTKFKELQHNQMLWELQLTSEESEMDIIKKLFDARTDVREPYNPQCSSISVSVPNEGQREQTDNPWASEDTSSIVIISDEDDEGDLGIKNQILEEHNVELKKEIDNLKKENEFLKCQLMLSTRVEEQNVELRKEVENLRPEN
ncbi:unnamed protein product [Ilex paraguariensis]|uniref:Aminotransferase-like plant mobile domain-containing protein n=1 Tax=Ilex paraguariensis TaxID=185542 RepID=A0ABC8RHN0_9AQUA